MKKDIIRYGISLFALFFLWNAAYSAQTVMQINIPLYTIQDKIDKINADKKQLEDEIAKYEADLKNIGEQATSLENTLKSLDATIKKNALDIKLTQNKINATELDIENLGEDIDKNTILIGQDRQTIAKLIVETARGEQATFIENLLAYDDIAEFWNETESMYQIQNKLREKVAETEVTKTILEGNKTAAEKKKRSLIALKSELTDRKTVLDLSKKEKNKLLADTKDKESNYQKILADKKALSLAFDKELLQFESELKFAIDPNSYPTPVRSILSWPLDIVKITQKFGVTDFSKTTNAYNGNGHNGVDFGTPIGTKIEASLSGTVVGTGNTDTVCPGASFGNWVFVRHDNGLSTLYGHLSLIKVRTGDRVFTGDTIGYSGNTGFSTGPHLHFGLYVTQGSRIMQVKSKVCMGTYTMPVADLKAYLDPLQYLPNL